MVKICITPIFRVFCDGFIVAAWFLSWASQKNKKVLEKDESIHMEHLFYALLEEIEECCVCEQDFANSLSNFYPFYFANKPLFL